MVNSDNLPGGRIQLLGKTHCKLEFESFNLDLCANRERFMVRFDSNSFKEAVPKSRKTPRHFKQNSGIVSLSLTSPNTAKKKNELFLNLRYCDMMDVQSSISFFGNFFQEVGRDSGAFVPQREVAPMLKFYKETLIDIVLSDCRLVFPSALSGGARDKFVFMLGSPTRSFLAEEQKPRNNLELQFRLVPLQHSMFVKGQIRESQAIWETEVVNSNATRSKHEQDFTEVLMERVHNWKFAASIQRIPGRKLESIKFHLHFDHAQARISQRILAQMLRMMASRLRMILRKQQKSSTQLKISPFSYKVTSQRIKFAREPVDELDLNEDPPAFLLSLQPTSITTSEIRKRKTKHFDSATEMLVTLYSQMLDHLMDGFLTPNVPNDAEKKRSKRKGVNISGHIEHVIIPAMERIRRNLLASDQWTEEQLEFIGSEFDDLIMYNVSNSNGTALRGLAVNQLEVTMPQEVFYTMIEALRLQPFLEHFEFYTTQYKIPNPDFANIFFQKLTFCEERKRFKLPLNKLRRNQKAVLDTLRILEKTNDVVILSDTDYLSIPNMKDKEYSVQFQAFEGIFRAVGHPFFRMVMEDFSTIIMASENNYETEPNISYESFRVQFDVDLLQDLYKLVIGQHEAAASGVISYTSLLTDFVYIMNDYAAIFCRQSVLEDKDDDRVQLTLTVDNFYWEFLRRHEEDKEFKMCARLLLAIPYAYFTDKASSIPFSLVLKTDLDLTLTQRRTTQRSKIRDKYLEEASSKRAGDFVETVNIIGDLNNLEVFHALPDLLGNDMEIVREAREELNSRHNSVFERGTDANKQAKLERLRRKEEQAAAASSRGALPKPKPKKKVEFTVTGEFDDDLALDTDTTLKARKERDEAEEQSRAAAAAAASADDQENDDQEDGSVRDAVDDGDYDDDDEEEEKEWENEEAEDDKDVQLNRHLSAPNGGGGGVSASEQSSRRSYRSRKSARSSRASRASGGGTRPENAFRNAKELAGDLPGIPSFFPIDNAAVRSKNGALLYTKIFQVVDPSHVIVHSTWEDSGLLSHNTEEDYVATRKHSGRRLRVFVDCPGDIMLNLSHRDLFFLVNGYQKLSKYRAQRAAELEAKIEQDRLARGDNAATWSIEKELELTLRMKWLKVVILDDESDLVGHDPVAVLSFAGLSSFVSMFSKHMVLEVDSTFTFEYAMVAPPLYEGDPINVDDVSVVPLIQDCAATFKVDCSAPFAKMSEWITSSELEIRKEATVKLTHGFLTRTRARIEKTIKMITATTGYSARVFEPLNTPPKALDFRKIRNSTGWTLWFGQGQATSSSGQRVLAHGEEDFVSFSVDPTDMSDMFDVLVQLDGSWEPYLVIKPVPGFTSRQVIRSKMGPNFDKLHYKEVEILVDTIEVPKGQLNNDLSIEQREGAVLEDKYDVVFDIHSTVRIHNVTKDPVFVQDKLLQPGEQWWVPVMMVSTGSVQIRRSTAFTWSRDISFTPTRPQDNVEVDGDKSQDTTTSFVTYMLAETKNISSDHPWCYCVRTARDAAVGVTEIEIRSPILIESMLPCPILASVTRQSNTNVRYFHPDEAYLEDERLRKADADDPNLRRVTEHIEKGHLSDGETWNVYGGVPYSFGQLALSLLETDQCRVDDFETTNPLDISDEDQLRAGFQLEDKSTGRKLRVIVAQMPSESNDEYNHYRHLRIFTQVVFVDRTNLQLRFSEDAKRYMTSHGGGSDQIANFKKVMYSTGANDPAMRYVRISSPRAPSWTPAVVFSKEGLDDPTAEEAPYKIVRAPTALHFTPTNASRIAGSDWKLDNLFSSEVVVESDVDSIPDYIEGLGPLVVNCTPRVRIINNLGCGVGVRRYSKESYRGYGNRDVELPMFVPSGEASPLMMFNDTPKAVLHPNPIELKSLSFVPVFIGEDDNAQPSMWEWSDAVNIDVTTGYHMSFHNSGLSRRLVVNVEVRAEGPHRTVIITNQNPTEIKYKVQNQSQRMSIRFSQKQYDPVDPLRKSRYWQTIHSGDASAVYAWDNPGFQFDSWPFKDVDSYQRPLLLSLRLFVDKLLIEVDVDMDYSRVGHRQHVRIPGAHPDVMVHTRTEVSTGAIVAVVSDYDPFDGLMTVGDKFHDEEKDFILGLLSRDEKSLTTGAADSELHLPSLTKKEEVIPPQTARVEVEVLDLSGVKFRDTCSVIWVSSYAKHTKKSVGDVRQIRRNQFSPLSFFYDTSKVAGSIDHETIHIDFYERHVFTGTSLKCTASFKNIRNIAAKTGSDSIVLKTIMHIPTERVVDSWSSTAADQEATLTIRVTFSSDTQPGIPGLVGERLGEHTLYSPRLKVQLIDEDTREMMATVDRSREITIEKVMDRSPFLNVELYNVRSVYSLSSSRSLIDLYVQNANVYRLFLDNDAPLADRAAREGTETVVNRLVLSSQSTVSDPLFHSSVQWRPVPVPCSDKEDPALVYHVNDAFMSTDAPFVKLDAAVALRVLKFFRSFDCFVPKELEDDPSKLLGIEIDDMSVSDGVMRVSYQTAVPPVEKPLQEAIAELMGATRSCSSRMFMSMSKNTPPPQKPTKRDAPYQEEMDVLGGQTEIHRSLVHVPPSSESPLIRYRNREFNSVPVEILFRLLTKAVADVPAAMEHLNELPGYVDEKGFLKDLIYNMQRIRVPLSEDQPEVPKRDPNALNFF